MEQKRWNGVLLLVGLIGFLALAGCGGGGGSSSSAAPAAPASSVVGIALPSEVSAISVDTSVAANSMFSAQLSALSAAVSDLPATSDYATTKAAKYVDEPTLEVFGIIETILKAIQQTHYADEGNVAASEAEAVPYKAIVSWEEDSKGQAQKQMQEWILKSFLATENSQEINVVHVWIQEPDQLVKVECKIYQAPTQNSEGAYQDYGKWSINARFFDAQTNAPAGSFFADADIDSNSNTLLRMNDIESRTENIMGTDVVLNSETKAIVSKTATAGYGKAVIPDWSYCFDTQGGPSPCTGPTVDLPPYNVQYAYNQDTLALQTTDKDSNVLPTVFKDRSNPAMIYYRYGLFDSTSGQNVQKAYQFGFPVLVDTANGTVHGYYGAWQGRHQLWAGNDGSTVVDGTVVNKEVWGNATPASYKTKTYNGTLTKRTLVDGSLSQVQDIPVEIWMSDNFDLSFDSTLNSGSGGWKKCTWMITGQDSNNNDIWQESCAATAFDLSALVNDPNSRKMVNIGGEICTDPQTHTGCSYPQFDYNQGGYFVESQYSQNPGTQYGPANWKDGDHLWINVNGSTYIVYDADFTGGKTGWVEKTVESFDEQTWTPTFAASGDVAFDFPADREYYINNQGANFVVRRIASANAASDYQVKMEVQTVVRPDNASSVLNGVSYFAVEWADPNDRSTFTFDSTSMLLKYASVATTDSASVDDTLAQGTWGLVAFDASNQKILNSDNSPLQFNWEYATQGNPWGAVTYLVKDSDSQIQYLSDPIALDPIDLTTVGGDTVTFSLRFDGWMNGLPDMHHELEKNDFVMTDAIKNKIVNIPKGTLVTSGSDSYYVKPLEVGVILPVLGAAPVGAPDPTLATSLDMTFSIPSVTDIGSVPTNVTTKCVEGVAVQ